MPEEENDDINVLLDELKEHTKVDKKSEFNLDKKDLETFILQYAGQLVKDSVEAVQDMKEYVGAAPAALDAEALAGLISSSSSAIGTLAKLILQDKKAEASKEIKQMDIDSKKTLQDENNRTKLLMNREDLLDLYMRKAEAIDVPSIESK